MTPGDVRAQVAAIEAERDDDEAAHSMEDTLHVDVLKAIAAGAPDARELAEEALRTLGISFARWCA